MPYPFTKIEPDTLGSIQKWDMPINEYLGIKFGMGFADSFFTAASRFTEDQIYSTGALMQPEVANKQFGIPGYLEFKEPIDIQRARLKNERKQTELKNLALIEAADFSGWHPKAWAGFGAMLAGSLANPLDLGLAFLPVVGSEKMAANVAKVGGSAFRQRLARGLITEEALAAKAVPVPRITGAVIDGTLNQAIVEIPVAIQKHRDSADYGISDSIVNIAFGGAFAGGIKSLGLALERAAKGWQNLDPRIKEAEIREIATQLINGERPKGGGFVEIDESIIRARAEAAIGPMETRKAMRKQAVEEFNKTLPEARVDVIQKVDGKVGDVVELDGISYRIVEQTEAETKATPLTPEQAAVAKNVLEDPELERMAQKASEGKPLAKEESELIAQALTPEERTAFAERVQQLKESKDIERNVGERRKQAINDFVQKKKDEYNAKLKDQLDVETKAEIQAQLSKGRAMTPEQMKRYSFSSKDTEAFTKAIEEDVQDIRNSIADNAVSEEEAIALQRELDEILEQIDSEKVSEDLMPGEKDKGTTPERITPEFLSKVINSEGTVNLKKVLDFVSDPSFKADQVSKALFKHLASIADKPEHFTPVKIGGDTAKGKFDKATRYQGIYQQFNDYGGVGGFIEILAKYSNDTFLTHNHFLKVMNHELLHAIVTSKLKVAGDHVKAPLTNLFKAAKEKAVGTKWQNGNAFLNEKEFLSEALSDKDFREWLATKKYENTQGITKGLRKPWMQKTMLGGLMEILRKILKLPDKMEIVGTRSNFEIDYYSMLDAALDISDELSSIDRTTGKKNFDFFDSEPSWGTKSDFNPSAEKAIEPAIPCVISRASL